MQYRQALSKGLHLNHDLACNLHTPITGCTIRGSEYLHPDLILMDLRMPRCDGLPARA